MRGGISSNVSGICLPQSPLQRGTAAGFHKQAGLASALAVIFDAPVGVVTDAPGLADDEIRSRQCCIDTMQVFFKPAIVMQKTAAAQFDYLAVGVDRA